MSSKEKLLKALLVESKDGEWGKGESFADSVEMTVIRGTDFDAVSQGQLEGLPVRYIQGTAAARKALAPRDILIETAGGSKGRPTGKTVFLRAELFSRNARPLTCASFARFLRIDERQVEPEFVYWYLQSLYKSGVIETYQVQHTGIARFQFTKFANSVQVPIPPRNDQQSIARLLGALDNRITLLRETNATLEAIAQALFKSWFVDFDPVRAKMEGRAPEGMDEATAALFPDGFEESGLGLMPRGWTIGTLEDLLVLQRGFDLPTQARIPGAFPIIAASGPSGTHKTAMAKGPGVVTGRSGVLGKVFLELEDYWPLNTTLWVKDFRAATPCYAYEILRTLDFSSFNAGSAVPTLNRNHIHGLPYRIPPRSCVEAFESVALQLHRRARTNSLSAQTLAALRNTLLPRLISGQLRLPEAQELAASANP